MKKILFDSTYFLPFIGIAIEGIDTSRLQEILSSNDYLVQLSEISLFELAAKGAKLSLNTVLSYQDVLRGLDTLRIDKRFKTQAWTSNPIILELAFKIRRFHADFIDCLILATAVCSADLFATYDYELFNQLLKHKKTIAEISTINPQFEFWFEDLSKESVALKKI